MTGGIVLNGQKVEDVLNLAMDASEYELEKSPSLDVGYNEAERTSLRFLRTILIIWHLCRR